MDRYFRTLFFIFMATCRQPEGTGNEALFRALFEPDEMERQLITLIDSAEERIEVALYGFDNDKIADALLAAAKRGVVIRCVTEYDSEIEGGWQKLIKALPSTPNLSIKLNNVSGIMHNKYFIIDRRYVVTGSTNLTKGMWVHFNNSVYFNSQAVAEEFLIDFEILYAGFSGGAKSGGFTELYGDTFQFWPERVHSFSNIEVKLYFTPYQTTFREYRPNSERSDGKVSYLYINYDLDGMWSRVEYGNGMNIVISFIDSAEHSIHVYSFAFTDKVLIHKLIEKQREGVSVNIWIDRNQFASSYNHSWKSYRRLTETVDLFKLCNRPNGGLLHHKVIVVDGIDVILGSLNYSNNAVTGNDENFMVLKNAPALAGEFLKEGGRIDAYSFKPTFEEEL